MKELFQEFEHLKPEEQAKLRLNQIMEEKEMKKTKNMSRLWKPAIVCALAIGILSVPVVQNYVSDSLQVKAKEVETINQKIEKANNQYKNGELAYGDYQIVVDGLVKTRDEMMKDIQAEHPDFKITLVESLEEDGSKSIEVTIEDKK